MSAVLLVLFAALNPECYCPTSVSVRTERGVGDQVKYVYAVKNESNVEIHGVWLGVIDGDAALSALPRNCEPCDEDGCTCALPAPRGWSSTLWCQEESNYHVIIFGAEDERARIRPGRAMEFSITLPAKDETYEQTGFRTVGEGGCAFEGRIRPLVLNTGVRPN